MKTSQRGLDLIKKWEGLRLEAYLCPAGVWTIGYGHIKGVKKGDKISQAQANTLLADDVANVAESAVNAYVNVPLNQEQFDALASFTFNLGGGNLKSSTLLKKLNDGDYLGAANEFKRWVKAGGKTLNGLVDRREAEAQMFVGK